MYYMSPKINRVILTNVNALDLYNVYMRVRCRIAYANILRTQMWKVILLLPTHLRIENLCVLIIISFRSTLYVSTVALGTLPINTIIAYSCGSTASS